MKKSKKMLIIIGIVIGIPLLIVLINNLTAAYYNKDYTDADKGAASEHYTLQKIRLPGKIQYHFDNAAYEAYRASTNPADTIAPEGNDGHLYYDTVNQKIIVETEEYVRSDEGSMNETVKRIYAIDKNGNTLKTDSLPKDIQSVKNVLIPFQKWSDDSQVLYMRHFQKQDFNMPSLNPLHGMGNPTGGHPTYYWDGPGYYDVKFKGDVLKVKIPCESGALLFTEDYEYATGLYYYLLPEQDIAFLVYSKTFEPDAIYMIRRK